MPPPRPGSHVKTLGTFWVLEGRCLVPFRCLAGPHLASSCSSSRLGCPVDPGSPWFALRPQSISRGTRQIPLFRALNPTLAPLECGLHPVVTAALGSRWWPPSCHGLTGATVDSTSTGVDCGGFPAPGKFGPIPSTTAYVSCYEQNDLWTHY